MSKDDLRRIHKRVRSERRSDLQSHLRRTLSALPALTLHAACYALAGAFVGCLGLLLCEFFDAPHAAKWTTFGFLAGCTWWRMMSDEWSDFWRWRT